MKYILLIIALACFLNLQASPPSQPTPTNATYIKDTVINGKTLKLFRGARGGRFTIHTSKVTGKNYNKYYK